jgi:hypothetical protein
MFDGVLWIATVCLNHFSQNRNVFVLKKLILFDAFQSDVFGVELNCLTELSGSQPFY